MMKYILKYPPGTKGDFICNWLNYKKTVFRNSMNASSRLTIHPVMQIYRETWKSYTYDQLDGFIKDFSLRDEIIFPIHHYNHIPEDIIENNNFIVLRITLNDNFCIKNVATEELFKNSTNSVTVKDYVIERTNRRNDLQNFKKYKKIKYRVDIDLVDSGIELSNLNRCNFIEKKLKRWWDDDILNYLPEEENYKNSNNIIKIDYQELIVDKNLTLLKHIDKNFNEQIFLNELDKTWLPEKIEMFGKIWYPYNYGYRKF